MSKSPKESRDTRAIRRTPTNHQVYFGDARELIKNITSETIQLVVTSPPYWNARDYGHKNQIGFNQSFEEYSTDLMKIWTECVRVLLPDAKIAVNIGNIYHVFPEEKRRNVANLMTLIWNQLSSFENLRFMGTIHWEKSTSRKRKVLMGSYPYPSAFLISTSLEAIFVFRKTGDRKVDPEIKELSKITKNDFRKLRSPLWRINGISNQHPAPFPAELPRRLIKMYTFYGDKVLDPFIGSGTTLVEAARLHRQSIGLEINEGYLEVMKELIARKGKTRSKYSIEFFNSMNEILYTLKT